MTQYYKKIYVKAWQFQAYIQEKDVPTWIPRQTVAYFTSSGKPISTANRYNHGISNAMVGDSTGGTLVFPGQWIVLDDRETLHVVSDSMFKKEYIQEPEPLKVGDKFSHSVWPTITVIALSESQIVWEEEQGPYSVVERNASETLLEYQNWKKV